MLDEIVGQMVGSFQQQMETNNPFSEGKNIDEDILYQTFRGGWYVGYFIGEVMKVALTAGALKAAKGTTIFEKVTKVVKSTTVGRLAIMASGKIDAAQFRVASTLAMGSVKIGKGALRGAKTVGSAVRVYQRTTGLNFNARGLSAVQQANLRRHLLASDDGVADLNRMSDKQRRDFLSLGANSCSRVFSSGITTMGKGCNPGDDDGFEALRVEDPETVERLHTLSRGSERTLSEDEVGRLSSAIENGEISTGDTRWISKVLGQEDGYSMTTASQ